MSNISVKNVGAKASLAGPISADEAQSQVAKLNAALPEIDQAKQWVEQYGDMNDRAELEILEGKIRSTLALLENFLTTGQWGTPGGISGAGDGGVSPEADPYFALNPGWNGNVILETELPLGGAYDTVAGWVAGGEFNGFVYIDDDGNPAQDIRLAFQASETTQKVEAFNHGNDIVYVETYLDETGGEKKRFWVGVGHVSNVHAKISIDAHNLDHGIQIDLSRTLRVGDGTPLNPANTVGGFIILGSDHDDTITGSQGDDFIAGLKGNDKLFGMAGRDEIYGDDWKAWNAQRGLNGLATDLADGDDTIDSGDGGGAIDGGGGRNYGFKTDKANKIHVQHDLENIGDALERGAWLNNGTRGFEVESEEAGGAVLVETGDGPNILDLKIPNGYSMAYANAEGTSLKITFVKDANGAEGPKTFTVIIKGALNDRTGSLTEPITLKLNGNGLENIVDFHNVRFNNNNFVAVGMTEGDTVLEPTTLLQEDGLTAEDLQHSTLNAREVESERKRMITVDDENQPWIFSATDNEHKEIEVGIDNRDGTHQPPFTLQIDPKDFEKAYVMRDPVQPEDLLVVLVKNGIDGESPEILVIRVNDFARNFGPDAATNLGWLKIERSSEIRAGEAPILARPIEVIPLNFS